jgi:hypothetical protein
VGTWNSRQTSVARNDKAPTEVEARHDEVFASTSP